MTTNVGVLIADDSATFLRAAVAVVEATPGFELLGAAKSGEQAVAVAATTSPDLVLIDVRMPGIGGLEAAQRIREARPSAVVVMITAESDPPTAEAVSAVVDKQRFCPSCLEQIWREHGPNENRHLSNGG